MLSDGRAMPELQRLSLVPTARAREFAETAREILADLDLPSTRAPEASWSDEVVDLVCGQLGWSGLGVPEEYGGLGLPLVEVSAVLHECGRVLLGAPVGEAFGAATMIARSASPDEVTRLLPGLAVGGLSAALAPDAAFRLETIAGRPSLTGTAGFVPYANSANLVVAGAAHGAVPVLLLLEGSVLEQATRQVAALTDRTRPVASLHLEGVSLPKSAILASGERARIEIAILRALQATLQSAQAIGVADRSLEVAVGYSMEREQFGVPIGSFQAIKHKLADVHVAIEQARSLVLSAAVCPLDDTTELVWRSSLAKSASGDAAMAASAEAIQILGGLGFTWDHPVHLYHKRAAVDVAIAWSGVACRDHVRAVLTSPGEEVDVPGDSRPDPDRDPFPGGPLLVQRFERWLAENAPTSWATLERHRAPMEERARASREWEARLGSGGWLGLTWPREFGGQGLSVADAARVAEALADAGAPELINVVGLDLVGPALLAFGTTAQKERHLPAILKGQLWCQGFSEPGAGSDLASLTTRASREGDAWIVSGRKIWSSYAAQAEVCLLLARTDPDVPRHAGISCFLLPMDRPGIDVQPIRQITGEVEFFEIVLDGVVLGNEALLGEEGQGWEIARHVLTHERGTMFTMLGMVHRDLQALVHLVQELPTAAAGRQELLARTVALVIREEAVQTTNRRASAHFAAADSDPRIDAILKLSWSELHQAIMRTAVEAAGARGLLEPGSAGAADDGRWLVGFLQSRAETILAGTSEIQRNVIAERVLGLPRQPRPAR